MPGLIDYLHFRFNSNNNNNIQNSNNTTVKDNNIVVTVHEISDDSEEEEEEEDADISNLEMAKQFQLFKIQKPILSKNDVLTFRKCRLHASNIKKQATNGELTDIKKNDKRTKTDDIPKYDDLDILTTQRIKSIKNKSDTNSKTSEYDDKWLRILKGVNRRNFTIGRKYRHVEERVWNNVSIQSLYTESPNNLEMTDMTAVD